jgi:cysteine desulfurase/selenocysteine lyase
MSIDWLQVRSQFPAFDHWIHLNTASFGQVPRAAVEAIEHHFEHRDDFACADFLDWFDDMDRVRGKVARLISCEADDVGFVSNAAAGLSVLLNGMPWKSGDQVVTMRGEFPNNLYAGASLARLGVELVEVDAWDRFYDALTPATRLVLLSTVNYVSGFRPPLGEASAELRRRGILLYLDGTQSLGALRFDAAKIQPDFLAVDGYKWLLCPNGASFICVPRRVREWLRPNVTGWRSDRGWRNVDHLNHGAPELPDGAERYEGGMLAFSLLYGMEAVIDMVLELGPETIERRVLELGAKTRMVLRELGAEVEDYASPIVAARFAGRDASQMALELRERRVIVAARHGRLRVSPHFYNNESDLDRLEEALT